MRISKLAIVLFGVSACEGHAPPHRAVRLATDPSDTVIINSHLPTTLPVQALDAAGQVVAAAPIRFAWAGGDALPVTETGAVTCSRSGNLDVRAVLESLTTRVFVRCRLVEYVRIPGPIQFVLGDSALSRPRELAVGAYGADRRPVATLTVKIAVADSHVAALRGTTLNPRSQGSTLVGVYIGDRHAATGVHVYQRVNGLDALDTLLRVHPERRAFAVPLRLEGATQYRQRLPPGHWMLALLPLQDRDATSIRIRVEGAACGSTFLNDPGRLGCDAGSNATVVVYRPFERRELAVPSAYLLVRGLFELDATRFVPRVLARNGSVTCVRAFLGERGYHVQQTAGDEHVIQAQRRTERLGTPARREWVEVRLVPDSSTGSLRGRAWAVDSYPAFDGSSRAPIATIVEPVEATVADARAALQKCGH